MKRISLLLLLTFSNYYLLAVSTIDNFSDGNFTQNPSWQGDSAFFKVNSAGELQSTGLTSGGQAALSLPYTCYGSMVWQFKFRLLFNPSSTNYARMYLYANHNNLALSNESIYLKTGGESGTTDRLELWQQQGTQHRQIWSGIVSRLSGSTINELQVRIRLNKKRVLEIESKRETEGNWVYEGQCTQPFPTGSCWFGFWYTCTSTRATQFYFDDLSIATGTPGITSVRVNDQQQLQLCFSQPMKDSVTTQLARYQLLPSGTILQANLIAPTDTAALLSLQLPQAGTYQLVCLSMVDWEGQTNTTPDTLDFLWRPPVRQGEVLITELMFNPEPSAGLPLSEYIELYNNSNHTLMMEGMSISDGTTTVSLPSYSLAAGEYVLLAPFTSASFFPDLHVIALARWPSLNNYADQLTLRNERGQQLHHLSYTVSSLSNDNRKEGGYAIELGNLQAWCKDEEAWNWTISNQGGTPAAANILHIMIDDRDGPSVVHVVQESGGRINLRLNEKTDTTLFNTSIVRLEPYAPITELFTQDEGLNWTILFTPDTMASYTIHLTQLSDCLGNRTTNISTPVISPHAPGARSLEPSEILFNPLPYGSDFIEVYNHSLRTLDLRKCKIGSEADGRRTVVTLPDEFILLPPEQYIALTTNEADLRNHYSAADRIYAISSLPPFPDNEACVWMEDSTGQRLFYFCYTETQHQQLLKEVEGVSLERISFQISEEENGNWTSSASTHQYATPGYQNSTFLHSTIAHEITIHPLTIEPGHTDPAKALVYIEFHPAQTGTFVRCRIYSEEGNLVNELANNNSVGDGSMLTWEGVYQKGSPVSTGLYLLFIECWNDSGYYKVTKQWIGVH